MIEKCYGLIYYNIFKYLDYKDYLNLRLVSKSLKLAVYKYAYSLDNQEFIAFDRKQNNYLKKMFKNIETSGGPYKILIKYYECVDCNIIFCGYGKPECPNCKIVKKINFVFVSEKYHEYFLEKFKFSKCGPKYEYNKKLYFCQYCKLKCCEIRYCDFTFDDGDSLDCIFENEIPVFASCESLNCPHHYVRIKINGEKILCRECVDYHCFDEKNIKYCYDCNDLVFTSSHTTNHKLTSNKSIIEKIIYK